MTLVGFRIALILQTGEVRNARRIWACTPQNLASGGRGSALGNLASGGRVDPLILFIEMSTYF